MEEILDAKKTLSKPLLFDISQELRRDLDSMRKLVNLNVEKVPATSHRPFWGILITHAKIFIRKLTLWLYQPLFDQISNFNFGVINILNRMTVYLDTHEERNLYTRNIIEDKKVINVINSKSVNTFEQANLGWFYHAFEQQFRGSEELIKKRLSIYVDYIKKAFEATGGKVLDIGSGRGEFLELLRGEGIPAIGVDLNDVMVQHCLYKGLNVEQRDAYDFITAQADESLAAVTAYMVIEHLSPEEIWKIINTALVKIKPGGVIILETVNPECLFALRNFYIDLTHIRPLPATTIKFLLESVGFRNVEVRFSSPLSEEYKLKGKDSNIQKLNEILFGWQDYAVVGWR